MKHKTKKLLCSVLAFCQLFAMTAFARPDWPSDTGIQAEAGALMDVDSGTMIFGQNSHVEYPPASITKGSVTLSANCTSSSRAPASASSRAV